MAKIKMAEDMTENADLSSNERSDMGHAIDELVAALNFKIKVLESDLDRLREERNQSEAGLSFLERELGKERAILAIEKESNEDKDEELEAQLRISRLEKEVVL